MHYAAFAAQAEAARLLLKLGAPPSIESYCLETPLAVALLRPAAFMGKDYAAVTRVLQQESLREQECSLRIPSDPASHASPGGGVRR